MLRPGGVFLFGVPAANPSASRDELIWNARRFYGPHRLAELFAGCEHIEPIDPREFGDWVHSSSILHVLRNPKGSGETAERLLRKCRRKTDSIAKESLRTKEWDTNITGKGKGTCFGTFSKLYSSKWISTR